ncbi:2367_t:CDS:1 [Diversispora eburnea]|uniref:2367_t:CDS:1 n=1 Tax=Diversispora eburnea TaxID=1213867 RepID=A0A9N8YKQ9_9GLOM|nr:2367_t:CDS:1 [Diversispora eburnea]
MKSSLIILFTLAVFLLASLSEAKECIRGLNAKDAEDLQKKFKSFTKNTPCKPDETACIGTAFAKCFSTGTKNEWSIQPCAGGLKCAVLPLVLKRGTSITCDTEEDRVARIKDAKDSCKPKKRGYPPSLY